jgi:CheY-like chemotaxis protein
MSGAESTRLRILLVEDHEDTVHLLARLLSREGHDVVTAGTVGDALAAAAAGPRCDVLVSDLGLPDGSGCHLMRELARLYGVPGVALTGWADGDGQAADARAAGFAAHLVKPIDFQALRTAIQAASGLTALPTP